jgi:hypothetical protein
MINISPIFGQSRAKKKEIADSKIAKVNSLKQIPYGSTFEKAYGYVIFQTWVGWIYRRGGWKWSRLRTVSW